MTGKILFILFFPLKKRSEGNFHFLWNSNANWPHGSEQWPSSLSGSSVAAVPLRPGGASGSVGPAWHPSSRQCHDRWLCPQPWAAEFFSNLPKGMPEDVSIKMWAIWFLVSITGNK